MMHVAEDDNHVCLIESLCTCYFVICYFNCVVIIIFFLDSHILALEAHIPTCISIKSFNIRSFIV